MGSGLCDTLICIAFSRSLNINEAIMNLKRLPLAFAISAVTLSTATNAVLGPVPIYLNTEYRTDIPVIDSIASTMTFTESDIKATGASTFLDFLATVPSIGLVDATGNIPALFIRGNEARHTLVLVDGVSVNDISSTDGAVGTGLLNVALNDIEKVEIIKNSGSVLYGSASSGGVISLTTKKGANGEYGVVSAKYGTHSSKTYNLSASDGNKDGFIRLSHSNYKTDGINARIDDNSTDKDGIKDQSTQIKVGNKNFIISYLKGRNKTEYDNTYSSDGSTLLADRKLTKITLNTNKKFSKKWKAKLSLAQTKISRDRGVNASTIGDKYKNTSVTLLNDVKVNDALLTIGLFHNTDANTTGNQKFVSKEVFANWQKNIESISVNTGFRRVDHDEFGGHTVYGLGSGKRLDNNIKLIANYNTAFKAPTLFQANKYNNPAKLKPETSKNIELGAEKKYDWGVLKIAVYENTGNDTIDYRACSDGSAVTYPGPLYSAVCVAPGATPLEHYFNEDELVSKGLELSINANVSGYNVDFNHNYNTAKKNNDAKQVLRRPKNITNLTINKQYAKFNPRLQIIRKSSSLDDTTFDGNGDTKLKGYTLVNLSTGYTISKNANATINVKNATNEKYTVIDSYNQLERTIEVGLDYKF